MGQLFSDFTYVFIPLFVATNVLGVVPLYISLTAEFSKQKKKELLIESLLTALIVAVLFILVGKVVFSLLSITDADFRTGGGIVLLVISVIDLVSSGMERRSIGESVGVVPIGIPLIMGPAALTTLLVSTENFGYTMTISTLIINLTIVFFVFRFSSVITRIIGLNGAKAFGKVASLFMAAIAVSMIRKGVEAFFIK